ncbi:MAG: hypothetical protein R3338_07495 [Thermoanaerobaculia bacterium]|nr:hypothetical protein [Thermoanaerobaculia bacterium]
MTISSDWIGEDIDLFRDDDAEEESERRILAWTVLFLLLAGMATTAFNVISVILW